MLNVLAWDKAALETRHLDHLHSQIADKQIGFEGYGFPVAPGREAP
jgi:hypothetical protein